MVECLTCDQRVVGSNFIGGTVFTCVLEQDTLSGTYSTGSTQEDPS